MEMNEYLLSRIKGLIREKKRPVVAYLTGNVHSDHPSGIVRRLYEMFGTEELDVRYYLGTECSMFLEGVELEESKYDYQYLSLYEYPVFDDVDVLIIGLGTISIYHGGGSMDSFLKRIPKVPCVLLETDTELEESVFIMVDNYAGMRKIVEHVICEHNCRRVAYVSGPAHNGEAKRRLDAFRDVMTEHGLPVEESLIGYGDFSEHSDSIVEEILKNAASGEPLDAIISANDEMCDGIYRILKKYGYQVGKDILVTGFDDMEMAPYMSPPLTTASQNLDEYSRLAVEKTKQYLRGEKPESTYIVPDTVIRESCGCLRPSSVIEEHLSNEHKIILSDLDTAHRHHQRTWIGSLILRELLIESADSGTFFEKLGKEMSCLNVEASLLCLSRNPMSLMPPGEGEDDPIIDLPDELVVPMLQTEKNYVSWPIELAPSIHRRDLGAILSGPTAAQSMVFLLFYEQYQYGALYVIANPENIPFFYMLSMEIGTGLRYLFMSMERNVIWEMLQSQNDMLLFTTSHDSLTNLLNRNGLLQEMGSFITSQSGKWMVAVMADLDHLKEINDTFGHQEGDSAIKTAADILLQAIGSDGIVGRTGGDEFMAIILKRGEAGEIRSRIEALCENYNCTSGKPYFVELSVGCSSFIDPESISMRSLFQKADEDLYDDKLARRKSVVKE